MYIYEFCATMAKVLFLLKLIPIKSIKLLRN